MELTRRRAIRLAGAASLAAATGAVLSAAPASPALADQNGWRWCRLCQGLWYAGNSTRGLCPVGAANGHDFLFSGDYRLPTASAVPNAQGGWAWCNRCQGLWYTRNSTHGVCPAGPGGHDPAGSGPYSLYVIGGGQTEWRWCQQCQGLWFAANGTGGGCPAPGAFGHSLAGSGNYHLTMS